LDLDLLEKRISQLVEESKFLHDFHNYECHLLPSGVIISFHCCASPDLSISAVHKASNTLEIAIKNEIDKHSQIYIFVEPNPDSQKALD
jgi:divalent metal cation (Fe/Co/Zn/Cd) transporter